MAVYLVTGGAADFSIHRKRGNPPLLHSEIVILSVLGNRLKLNGLSQENTVVCTGFGKRFTTAAKALGFDVIHEQSHTLGSKIKCRPTEEKNSILLNSLIALVEFFAFKYEGKNLLLIVDYDLLHFHGITDILKIKESVAAYSITGDKQCEILHSGGEIYERIRTMAAA